MRFCFVLAVAFSGCSRQEHFENISLADPALAEFCDLQKVDRAGLHIPELSKTANVDVERGSRAPYDAMLHIYSKQDSRTIAFKRVNGEMKWIHEQVIVEGPDTYTTVDGTYQEKLTFTYETSPMSGNALNKLVIDYSGPRENLKGKELSPDDVWPLVEQWAARP